MELHPTDALTAARAAIAAACLDALPDAALGSIVLRDHQRLSIARARRILAARGGCLIADDVGHGKTYIALGLAASWTHALCVVPSALRDTWRAALDRTGVRGSLISHESLSRAGAAVPTAFDGIVVDESHHFRNPSIRRYEALAKLAARAPMVLLSATPLQNRLRDLAAQVALFAGAAALELDAEQLNEYVVRGPLAPDAPLPTAARPEWLEVDVLDDEVLSAILALPEPVRARDAGDEGALRLLALVRAWASSRAALRTTLRRRRRMATAIEQGLAEGLLPSRSEARAWSGADDAIQLAMASVLLAEAPSAAPLHLLAELSHEREALDRLAALFRRTPDPDVARAEALRTVRRRFPGERILAFSEFESTVRALHALLQEERGVGVLSSHSARIASGRIPRRELLARFAPIAQGSAAWRDHEQVTLLLTTDILSEGLNLQDASIVVHLDLPWNPARLRQRVGRVHRPGGHAIVRSFLLTPPAHADVLLKAEGYLERKHALAHTTMGCATDPLPVLTSGGLARATRTHSSPGLETASDRGEIMSLLHRWRGSVPAGDARIMATVQAPMAGWLACLEDGFLVNATGMSMHDALETIDRASPLPDTVATCGALTAAEQWRQRWRASTLAATGVSHGKHRSACLAELARLAHTLPRHQQPASLPLIARLSSRLRHPLPLATERDIAARVHHLRPGTALGHELRAIIEVLPWPANAGASHAAGFVAVIVFHANDA